jgi:hypothetical protein
LLAEIPIDPRPRQGIKVLLPDREEHASELGYRTQNISALGHGVGGDLT